MRHLLLFASLIAVPALASAQNMNAEEFHKRATALQKKGALALFSGGEIKALMNEGKASGEAARAQRQAAKNAGKPQRYCPPANTTSMDSNEFMKRLSAIPAADRQRITMTEATTRILSAKFPCPK